MGQTVVDVNSDPDIPPLPPHAEGDNMKQRMRRGAQAKPGSDEDAAGVIRTGVKPKMQDSLPGTTSNR